MLVIGIILTVVGAGLLIYGIIQSTSFAGQLINAFGGGDIGLVWIIIGAVVLIVGIILMVIANNKKKPVQG
ncbi:MAG: hypothetical protein ACOX8Q_06915 [Christensenellales bacterium]|jgi:hypothetical protein